MSRLLVVAPRREVRDNPFDGFAIRHRYLVEALGATWTMTLGVIDDDSPTTGVWSGDDVVCLPPARTSGTRSGRLGDALATAIGRDERRGIALDSALADLAAARDFDAALTIGPWVDAAYRPVWRRLPTLHLFEEDLSRVAALASQSRQARALRRTTWALESCSWAQPAHVVSISRPEVTRARRRFPRVPISCIPFGLDRREWPQFTGPSAGDAVAVVGNFAEERNAEGLLAVLEAADRLGVALRLDIVSGPGLHPSLARWERSGVVALLREPEIVGFYRRSAAALVPARTVTGQKTTILQAWSCGVPVVTTPECAATVNGSEALLVGSTSESLVRQLERLLRSPADRVSLAEAGLRLVEERHTAERQVESVQEVFASFVGPA
jgi:glycosyltransferase involved in cell wall biosynthesis